MAPRGQHLAVQAAMARADIAMEPIRAAEARQGDLVETLRKLFEEADRKAQERHVALLRMLGHVKDALTFPLSKRELLRAICYAGYNANDSDINMAASPAQRAAWADVDAEALIAVPSDQVDPAERLVEPEG